MENNMKLMQLIQSVVITFLLVYMQQINAVDNNYIQTGSTKIGLVGSYNQYGNGDAIFTVSNPIQQCGGGFWLTKSDPGFSANMAMIVSAFIAKTTVNVAALPDQIWSGSGTTFCKLYTIQFVAE